MEITIKRINYFQEQKSGKIIFFILGGNEKYYRYSESAEKQSANFEKLILAKQNDTIVIKITEEQVSSLYKDNFNIITEVTELKVKN